jgi:hypothetical protein
MFKEQNMLGKTKMFKMKKKNLLLFIILAFSLIYRILLMNWATYPPGADIGLHESVIKSITSSGKTNFLWNNYQMGGGLSLTFPGYHIFAAYIILMTGLPDYLVHSLVVSVFSSFIVLCAFLLARTVWSESTGFVVAFLVAISRFDVEMLLWGGYPNAITLMLIPLVFYLYLQRERFSSIPFVVSTAILSGAIFLTHSLSSVMFVGITFCTVIVGTIFSKRIGVSKKSLLLWLVPIFLGAAIIFPFLADAVPAYLGANAETFTGGISGIRMALLSTRVLPLEWVIPLFACVILFFLFSKEYRGKFFTIPALLFTLWVLVPMIFTQGFLVGLYTDYNRFLYFVILPVIVLISLGIDHGSGFFAKITDAYLSLANTAYQAKKNIEKLSSRLLAVLSRKNVYTGFAMFFLLFSFLAIPFFLTPFQGARMQSFYQVMTDPGYEAVQWARQNTSTDSIFVSDALYGWWLGGFAERPTISAVDPQYLTLAREFEPAKAANRLLDTDYVLDNGLIQVREDGGYVGRHNPGFLAKLNWTYFPYPYFHFSDNEITISARKGDNVQLFDLMSLQVMDMTLENNGDFAYAFLKKGNDLFNFTQKTTIYRGVRFVNMSITIESDDNVSIDLVRFILHTKGEAIVKNDTVGLLDVGAKVLGQLIFAEKQPDITVITWENPSGLDLLYNLEGRSSGEIQILVGVFSVTNDPAVYQDPEVKNAYFNKMLTDNINSSQEKIADLPIEVFDYKTALQEFNISYIACRKADLIPKFANDPTFSLVFINDDVAIFLVKRCFN